MIILPPQLVTALQEQMNQERISQIIYENLANAMDMANLAGAAKFFRHSADEEYTHFQKQREYLIDRNVMPVLRQLQPLAPNSLGLLAAFQAAQAREADGTQAVDELYDLAEETGDNATCIFLQFFVSDQVESERELLEIAGLIQRAGSGLGEQWADEQIGDRIV